jgi:hypothetical protein
MQDKVTVRSSVLEVLHAVAKFCDVYLMERILDDESGVCANQYVARQFFYFIRALHMPTPIYLGLKALLLLLY